MQRDIGIINNELETVKKQIDRFKDCNYDDERKCYGEYHVLNGLDKSDFHRVKDSVLTLLQECYNKKLDEIIDFCVNHKFPLNEQ